MTLTFDESFPYIYWETNDIPEAPFGKRSVIYSGPAHFRQIFEEVYGQHVKIQLADVDWGTKSLVDPEIPDPSRKRGKMFVPVFCAALMRDEMRLLVQHHVQKGVGPLELDYQPELRNPNFGLGYGATEIVNSK